MYMNFYLDAHICFPQMLEVNTGPWYRSNELLCEHWKSTSVLCKKSKRS